ncbi:hypothetical protein K474DRAFT_1193825 [Panus rudis PR-1116 ss-1]|nr:hypothetical protein K474DRAFT_1193825 [Panus rudis PR-1116 ss-1]
MGAPQIRQSSILTIDLSSDLLPHPPTLRLYSFAKDAPDLTVRTPPNLFYGTPHTASPNHPIYGLGERGRKQVMPARVLSYEAYPRFKHVASVLQGPESNDHSAPELVAIKWARGRRCLRKIAWEYELYSNELKQLQGSIVPRCYGIYVGVVEGCEVGCLVLEWCGGAPLQDENQWMCQIITATSKVHTSGIQHNALLSNSFRHFITGPDRRIRLVDFSNATRNHVCPGSVPRLFHVERNEGANGCGSESPPEGCKELDQLENAFLNAGMV